MHRTITQNLDNTYLNVLERQILDCKTKFQESVRLKERKTKRRIYYSTDLPISR